MPFIFLTCDVKKQCVNVDNVNHKIGNMYFIHKVRSPDRQTLFIFDIPNVTV